MKSHYGNFTNEPKLSLMESVDEWNYLALQCYMSHSLASRNNLDIVVTNDALHCIASYSTAQFISDGAAIIWLA